MSAPISDAVILMAGKGSRLRVGGEILPKPLVRVGERPLISYLLDALVRNGITKACGVVGFDKDVLIEGLRPVIPREISFEFVSNAQWQKQNGVSLLAAREYVSGPFLLAMSDHLFDPKIVDLLLGSSEPSELTIAADRKISEIFDLDDAMKLATRGKRVTAIGKDLQKYDAIDCGAFACSAEIFGYLERAMHGDDCSLADGIRLMAADGKVRAVDIGDAWWQDVDTPEMLTEAQRRLQKTAGLHHVAS